MSDVVSTWTPTDANGIPTGPLELIGWTSVFFATSRWIDKYGSGARDDADTHFGRDGGFQFPVHDPAGKLLGWSGYWFPEALERRGVSLDSLPKK